MFLTLLNLIINPVMVRWAIEEMQIEGKWVRYSLMKRKFRRNESFQKPLLAEEAVSGEGIIPSFPVLYL
jgi:hypothetical protein